MSPCGPWILADLDLLWPRYSLNSLGTLNTLWPCWTYLSCTLGFLADPVNPSLRLLPFLLSLLSLQLSLSPQYLLLLLSPRLLLSGQVVHQMDQLLPPDLMAPLGRSVLLVLRRACYPCWTSYSCWACSAFPCRPSCSHISCCPVGPWIP